MIETTEAAVSVAAGLLRAFSDEDAEHFYAVMASQYGEGAEPGAAYHTFCALLALVDRLLDYTATVTGTPPRELLTEATRVLLAALDQTNTDGKDTLAP